MGKLYFHPINYAWKGTDRPNLTTSRLPPDLLKAITNTAKSNRAVEVEYDGDEIGVRRLIQNLGGLARRGYFGGIDLITAKRGGKLYLWLGSRKRGRSPNRGAEHSVALPPEDTSFLSSEPSFTAPGATTDHD